MKIPSLSNSLSYTPVSMFEFKNTTPLLHALCLAFVSNESGLATVVMLFCVRGPSTVFLVISLFIIYAVQCFAIGSNAHVFKKCHKTLSPSVAHINPFSTIPMIIRRIRVMAPQFHRMPCVPGWRFAHSVSFTHWLVITSLLTGKQ